VFPEIHSRPIHETLLLVIKRDAGAGLETITNKQKGPHQGKMREELKGAGQKGK